MEKTLKELQEAINDLLLFSDENVKIYIQLLKDASLSIEKIEATPDSLLDNYKNQALAEISNELENRLNNHFFQSDPERKKHEFRFSKSLSSLAITNILMNL